MSPLLKNAGWLPVLLVSALAGAGCDPLKNANIVSGPVGTTPGQKYVVSFTPVNSNASASIAINYSNTNIMDVAQSFKLPLNSATASVNQITLSLKAISSTNQPVNGNVSVYLESDNNGPSGGILGSDSINADTISLTGFSNYIFSIPPVSITPGQVYWIVVSASYPSNNTSYIEWAGAPVSTLPAGFSIKTTNPTYPNQWVGPAVYSAASEMVFGIGSSQ
ncbi:MAG: hypothetical protein P4M08_11455 [Oligoflexia bacterium]|nr:hypothetical protein [Oligoflexia bacterium]